MTEDRDKGGVSAIVAEQADEFAHELAEHDTTLEETGPVEAVEESTAFRDSRAITTTQATELIDFDLLFRKDNVRTSNSLNLPKMVASFKNKGFKPNHPLVVSKRGDRYLVLCGNRRTEGLEIIRQNDLEIFESILPDNKIPCIVHRGLTEQQEILLRIDHSDAEDREPLDDWGEFLAVRQLMRVGYSSQRDIAGMLGKFNKNDEPNRSWVQQRVNLARMPKFVQDEMEKLCTDGTVATLLRWAHIPGLFKIYNKEFDLGHKIDVGPNFQERWDEIFNPDAVPEKPKGLTRSKIVEMSKLTGSFLIKKVLYYVAREPATVSEDGTPTYLDWSDVEGEILEAEAALETLKNLAAYMGENSFRDLISESKEANTATVDSELAADAVKGN